MPKERKRKVRRRKMRSFRKLKLFLFAFGTAGAAMGAGLCVVFSFKGNWKLVAVGLGYVLLSAAALGARGILMYLDETWKERRHRRTLI